MADNGQGSENSNSKRKLDEAPVKASGKRTKRGPASGDASSATSTAPVPVSAELQSLLDALQRAMLMLKTSELAIDATAKDSDQLNQVKEIYVAIVEAIARRWAVYDDSPELHDKLKYAGFVPVANEGHPRIDQTYEFFEQQKLEDPVYAIDRAVVLFVSRREYLNGNGIKVDEEIREYLKKQQDKFKPELAEDHVARAVDYLQKYITWKGKPYKGINNIKVYLDKLNLLMGLKRPPVHYEDKKETEILRELKAVYVDLAQCKALTNVKGNFHGPSRSSVVDYKVDFNDLKKSKLIVNIPADFVKSRKRTYEAIYKSLEAKSEGAERKATELATNLRVNAKAFRVSDVDIDAACLQIAKWKQKKANAAGAGRA